MQFVEHHKSLPTASDPKAASLKWANAEQKRRDEDERYGLAG